MKEKLLFSFCFTLAAVALVSGQARTVTNQDLEKYRDQRVKAEADLRENYARLGFASPEERARRNAESAKASAELSARLLAERLDRERKEAERAAAVTAVQYLVPVPVVQPQSPQWFGYYFLNGRRYRRIYDARPTQSGYYAGGQFWPTGITRPQTGYFAGGQFWPTGSATRPQPLFVRPRR